VDQYVVKGVSEVDGGEEEQEEEATDEVQVEHIECDWDAVEEEQHTEPLNQSMEVAQV
jgi:hypothetical protein